MRHRIVAEINMPAENATGLAAKPVIAASSSFSCKRVMDIVGASILLLLFAPLFAILALLIRRDGGAVIFKHRRVGRAGRFFYCLKFRTMVPNAEELLAQYLEAHPEYQEQWIREHKLKDDPRITRVGEFLRKTSLDELPQLWNVLRGEMSLVGVRPVVQDELEKYGEALPFYLALRPGLTGLWQVSGRNDTSYAERVALDVAYVQQRTLWLDLKILFKTVLVVLRRDGAY